MRVYLKQHVFLAGSQIHFVLVVVYADVDNVGQKLLVARDHLQLLMQALHRDREGITGHLQMSSNLGRVLAKIILGAKFYNLVQFKTKINYVKWDLQLI